MPEWLSDFHLLRPWWLLAIPIGVVLAILRTRRSPAASGWAGVIAPSLLPFLTRSIVQENTRRRTGWLLAIAWSLACLGLSGPTAMQLPQPLQRDTNALVVVFDLSPSMRTRDLAPDRLTRARLKTIDFLRERREGMTGLVIYARDAFPIIPMTPDVNTILHLIPELEPEIMPSPGSHVEAALRQAIELLITGGHATGRLLLVTDGVTSEAQQNMDRLMRQFGEYRLDILGVGTADGGPIPLADGSFARDARDRIVVASLPEQRLRNLANRAGGRYATLTPDDRDLDHLLAPYRASTGEAITERTHREFDLWHDLGYWFALALLPLIVLVFRRGAVASLALLLPLALNSPPATASVWSGLWQNPDQRASRALTDGDATLARDLFRDPSWRGVAAYEVGDYEEAEHLFSEDDSATGHYNRGNALAAQGRFPEAIEAYEQALAQDPELDPARHNRERAEELMRQQEQEHPPQQQPSDSQSAPPQDQQESTDSGSGDAADPGPQDQQEQEPGESGGPNGTHPDEADPTESAPSKQAAQQPPPTSEAEAEAQEQEQEQERAGDSPSPEPMEPSESDTQPDTQETSRDPGDERMEQWLRRVPDDPGGLLRRQLQREALLRTRESQRARSLPPGVEEDRW